MPGRSATTAAVLVAALGIVVVTTSGWRVVSGVAGFVGDGDLPVDAGGTETVVERLQEGDAAFLCRVDDDVDFFRSRMHGTMSSVTLPEKTLDGINRIDRI